MSEREPSINPTDAFQVDLYESLRSSHDRVTVKEFKRWLAAKNKDTMSTSYKITIWCVPKENFPDGLPADFADRELTEDKVKTLQRTGGFTGNADFSACYLIDDCVEKAKLGPNVGSVEFVKQAAKVAASGSSESDAPLSNEARSPTPAREAATGSPATGGDNVPPAPNSPATGGDNVPPATGGNPKKRTLARAFSDPIPEADKTQKRCKVLKDVLGALRDDLVVAADKQRWVSSSALQTDTVQSLFGEMCEVLKSLRTANPSSSIDGLATKVLEFMARHIWDRPCYQHIVKKRNNAR